MSEHLVEAIEMLLVLHQGCAGEVVEVHHLVAAVAADNALVHGFEQGEEFLERDRHLGGAQLMEEMLEHRRTPAGLCEA